MNTCSIHSLSQDAFDSFLAAPTEDQIKSIAGGLRDADVYEAPWKGNPEKWVAAHLVESDWYQSLSDAEDMVAWDGGMFRLFERPEFEKTQHAGEHGSIPYTVMEWLTLAVTLRDNAVVPCYFGPFRYFGLGSRQDEVFYWPCHALLPKDTLGQFLKELHKFDELLHTLEQHDSRFTELFTDEIAGAKQSLVEELPILDDIHSSRRMWYSEFDT